MYMELMVTTLLLAKIQTTRNQIEHDYYEFLFYTKHIQQITTKVILNTKRIINIFDVKRKMIITMNGKLF